MDEERKGRGEGNTNRVSLSICFFSSHRLIEKRSPNAKSHQPDSVELQKERKGQFHRLLDIITVLLPVNLMSIAFPCSSFLCWWLFLSSISLSSLTETQWNPLVETQSLETTKTKEQHSLSVSLFVCVYL